MEIPTLFDWRNPTAPLWAVPSLTPDELDALFQVTVMFVGFDPNREPHKQHVPIGSGFIVSAEKSIIVVSAAHIFSWWAGQVYPPKRHALSGITGDSEDLRERLTRLVENNNLAAFVSPRGCSQGCICPIQGISMNPNPRDMDVAVLELPIPASKDRNDFRILMIDSDPFLCDEPILLAGFKSGGRALPYHREQFSRGLYEQELVVRVGRVSELAVKADGHRSPMHRVNIPTLPAMSGGPMILLRAAEFGVPTQILHTAAGVISSGRLGPAVFYERFSGDGTWVTPIASALLRKINTDAGPIALGDAIKRGLVPSAGRIARSIEWEQDPDTGHMLPRVRRD